MTSRPMTLGERARVGGRQVRWLSPYLAGGAFRASRNPAVTLCRDAGPPLLAVVAGWASTALPGNGKGYSWYWWVRVGGPLIGGTLGALAYDLVVGRVLEVRPSEDNPAEPGRTPGSPGSER